LNSCRRFSCKLLPKLTLIWCSRLGGCWCCEANANQELVWAILGQHLGHDLHTGWYLITFKNRFSPQSFHIRLKYHEDKIVKCKCLWPTARWELIMIAIICQTILFINRSTNT
jgi:hypothetical protein